MVIPLVLLQKKRIAITALKVVRDMQIALGLHVKTDVGSYFFWVQAPSSRHPHDWLALRRAEHIPALLGCCNRRCSEKPLFLTARRTFLPLIERQ